MEAEEWADLGYFRGNHQSLPQNGLHSPGIHWPFFNSQSIRKHKEIKFSLRSNQRLSKADLQYRVGGKHNVRICLCSQSMLKQVSLRVACCHSRLANATEYFVTEYCVYLGSQWLLLRCRSHLIWVRQKVLQSGHRHDSKGVQARTANSKETRCES